MHLGPRLLMLVWTTSACLVFLAGASHAASSDDARPDGIAGGSAADTDAVSDIGDLDLLDLLSTPVRVGSETEVEIKTIPAVVEVLTAAEIRDLGLRDLREALFLMTGVYEAGSSFVPVYDAGLRVRTTSTSSRLLFLLDDHIMLDPGSDGLLPYGIPIESIERIELLRGPAAVLYGTSAVAGVVRVVTRRFERRRYGVTVEHGAVGAGGGASAFAEMSLLGVQLRADVQARRPDDRRAYFVRDTLDFNGIEPDRAPIHRLSPEVLGATVSADVGPVAAHLRFQQQEGTMLGLMPTPTHKAGTSFQRLLGFTVGAEEQLGPVVLRAHVAYDRRERDVSYGDLLWLPFDGQHTRDRSNQDAIDWRAVATLPHSSWSASAGAQGRWHRASGPGVVYEDGTHHALSKNRGNASMADYNLFVHGRVHPTDKMTIHLGTRITHFRASAGDLSAKQTHPMFRLAFVASPSATTTVKLLYGRAFRLPTMTELFAEIGAAMPPAPSLRAEFQDALELATDLEWSNLTLRLNAYVRESRGVVVQIPTVPTGFVNSDEPHRMVGQESCLRWLPSPDIITDGSLALQQPLDHRWTRRRGSPLAVATVRVTLLSLADDSLRVTPSVKYVSPIYRATGSHDVFVGIASAYRLSSLLEVGVAAQNIFGARTQMPYWPPPHHAELRRSRLLRLWLSANL